MSMYKSAWERITLPLLASAGGKWEFQHQQTFSKEHSSTKATEWNMLNNESNSSAAFGNVSQFNM